MWEVEGERQNECARDEKQEEGAGGERHQHRVQMCRVVRKTIGEGEACVTDR